VVDPDGAERRVNEKGSFTAAAGSRVHLAAPGSGGFGPPGARARGLIRADVVDGYVTLQAAARDYGVADPAALACPHCPAVPPDEAF
jgi:N-methylhydantoinase B